ncbi:MAG: hypothetical protein ABJM19_10745 [Marinobacter sp.]|uniref:hypothetical protein n=1 Tax=Marinobacter sp. TaxID=50741 RepID=UPI00329A44E6
MRHNASHLSTKKIATAVTLIGFSSFCLSAPQISKVDGTLQNGATITISGARFGNIEEQLRKVWDNVDNTAEYATLGSGEEAPTNQGPWTQNGNPWSNPVTIYRGSDQRHQYSKANYHIRTKGYLGWPRAFDGNANRKLYVSWWFKPNVSPDAQGGHNKFIRIWDDPSGNYTRISWTQVMLGAYQDQSGEIQSDWGGWKGDVAQWNRHEIYVDSENQSIQTWVNGQLTHSVKNFYKQNSSAGLTIGLVGFDPNRSENYGSFESKMDDIYASSVPARVELSTSATWSGAGSKKELQPFEKWTDSSIDVNVNLGQFKSSDKLYVYVIDPNGLVNQNGVDVTGASCEKCPRSPNSLEIK